MAVMTTSNIDQEGGVAEQGSVLFREPGTEVQLRPHRALSQKAKPLTDQCGSKNRTDQMSLPFPCGIWLWDPDS